MHQRGVYHRKIHTIDELKQRPIEVWCGLEQSTVDMAVDQWRKRLRACVQSTVVSSEPTSSLTPFPDQSLLILIIGTVFFPMYYMYKQTWAGVVYKNAVGCQSITIDPLLILFAVHTAQCQTHAGTTWSGRTFYSYYKYHHRLLRQQAAQTKTLKH